MGAYLSEPITAKDSEDLICDEGGYAVGCSSMQGWRSNMEDAHLVKTNFAGNDDDFLVGVFDGHGGGEVAQFCKERMADVVTAQEEYGNEEYGEAMRKAFLEVDDKLFRPYYREDLQKWKKQGKGDSILSLLQTLSSGKEEFDGLFDVDGPLGRAAAAEGEDKKDEEQEKLADEDKIQEVDDNDTNKDKKEDGEKKDDEETKAPSSPSTGSEEKEKADEEKKEEDGDKKDDKKAADDSEKKEDDKENDGDKDNKGGKFVKKTGRETVGGGSADIHSDSAGDLSVPQKPKVALDPNEKDDDPKGEVTAGCTSVAILKKGTTLYIANAGDSRAVLCRGTEALPLSHDHKPEDEIEKNRIEDGGGYIENGRVNGNLNLTRAIGDLTYKKDMTRPAEEQIITANPDIKTVELEPEDEFIVLGCDGIYEVKSNQEIIDFVRERIPAVREEGGNLSKICEEFMDATISPDITSTDGMGCDNMTMVIVDLKWKASGGAAASAAAKE